MTIFQITSGGTSKTVLMNHDRRVKKIRGANSKRGGKTRGCAGKKTNGDTRRIGGGKVGFRSIKKE